MRNELITPHECWLSLGASDNARRPAYQGVFKQELEQKQLEVIRYGMRKGLPTGNDVFKRQVEAAFSVKLSNGKIGRPVRIS
jgi:putative transposase